jgi:hypothetical protein
MESKKPKRDPVAPIEAPIVVAPLAAAALVAPLAAPLVAPLAAAALVAQAQAQAQAKKEAKINKSKGLLKKVGDFLKPTIQEIGAAVARFARFARAITIIQKPPNVDQINIPISSIGVAAVAPSLTITIRSYTFTLISKCVLFDRKYVNFDVYRIFNAGEVVEVADEVITIDNIIWKLKHRLTAYGSSSQVGSWRLCKLEAGNRLNKFDDYVQSTVLQWELARFICYWFYRYQLPWDNEPNVHRGQYYYPGRAGLTLGQADQMNLRINARNFIRNNLFCVRPLVVMPNPVPPLININQESLMYTLNPPPGYSAHTIHPVVGYEPDDLSAIPYVYVMDGSQYQYQTLPNHYVARTLRNNNITCKIVDRGLGSVDKYSVDNGICGLNIGPLPAPCPFTYWTPARGNCGNQIDEGIIKERLGEFSTALNAFYEIPRVNGRMVITELYRDCMIYKNFKQEATIFKVTLDPKEANILCIPPDLIEIPEPIAFYKQTVDIIFVNYSIKQYTSFPTVCLSPCYPLDPQPLVGVGQDPPFENILLEENLVFDRNAPEFDVQGYYVLTIIPTQVLLPDQLMPIPCEFNNITEIGLFQYYIKAGFYVCKPLDYRGQCILRSFPINYPDAEFVEDNPLEVPITTINMEYAYIGHRLNSEVPFKTLFGWTDAERSALSTYSEQIISSPATTVGTLIRQLTNAKSDTTKTDTLIRQINEQLNEPCRERLENKRPMAEGGHPTRKTNKNKKQNKNKLQTYKRRKYKGRKRITKKNRKKRRTRKIRSRS